MRAYRIPDDSYLAQIIDMIFKAKCFHYHN